MTDTANVMMTRRKALATLGAGASALFAAPSQVRASIVETARGTVFDVDGVAGNARHGISGVMVSNGRDVTITGADGAWSLPVRDGDCIFVIKPAQWSLPECSGLSRGYYLHQPNGTPAAVGLTSPQIEPTGELPASIDFGLVRSVESQTFDVLLVADTQAANSDELRFVREELLASVSVTKPAFAIHHGDVMGDDLVLLPAHLAITAETGIPWHHCPGNHDMNLDSPSQMQAFDAWKAFVGPTHTAFQYAGATFILLNNVEYFGKGSRQSGGRGYRGAIGYEQLRFVENILKHVPDDQLIVVSMHIPLVSFETPDSISDTTADRRALLKILSKRRHAVSFAGHSHTTEHHYLGADEGFFGSPPHHHHVLTAACGSWWSGPNDERGIPIADSRDGSPKGVHVLTVDGNRYTTRFVASPSSTSDTLRVMIGTLPGTSAVGQPSHNTHVLVDVFDGGPKTRVTCEILGDAAQTFTLKKAAIEDPHIVESYARHKALCKPWVVPARSSHIWAAPLPPVAVTGQHELIVRVSGEYGEYYETRHTFEVSA